MRMSRCTDKEHNGLFARIFQQRHLRSHHHQPGLQTPTNECGVRVKDFILNRQRIGLRRNS